MFKRSKVVMMFATVALAAGVIGYRYHRVGEPPAVQATRHADAHSATAYDRDKPGPEEGAVQSHGSVDGRREPDLFREASALMARSNAGDGRASREIADIYRECWMYALNPAGFMADARTVAALSPSTAANRIKAASIVEKRCRRFPGQKVAPDQINAFTDLAMRQGDVAAQAQVFALEAMLGKHGTAEVKGIAEQVIASRDPDAFAAFATFMGPPSAGHQQGLHPIPSGSVVGEAAWNIAACRLGRSCGPSSSTVLQMCLAGGINCELRDVESYYRQAVLPPADLPKLEQLVASLIQGEKK